MYKKIYSEQKALWKRAKVPSLESYKLKPNDMQVQFSNNLKKLIDNGEKRALLVSSTGTGKTYASAFALRNLNPDRVLFLVHRAQIAKQALKSFKKVFVDTKTMGLLSGEEKDLSSDFIFSTMNMMAKSEIREQFKKDEFDAIVYDECHRIASKSYQDILEYFEPKIISLGMTASPERMDGVDVFKTFDNNIAHEIRLEQALKEDLLCPFNYFGISDIEIDGELIDDETSAKNFNLLTSDERVSHIIKNAEFFGYHGDRAKGLIFCSTKKEAKELS